MSLGMAWPEEVDQFVGSTWYLKWQSEAEINFKSHKTNSLWWYIGFLFRSLLFGFVVFHVLRFMRKIPRALGYGPFRKDPNLRKLRRVVSSTCFYHIHVFLVSNLCMYSLIISLCFGANCWSICYKCMHYLSIGSMIRKPRKIMASNRFNGYLEQASILIYFCHTSFFFRFRSKKIELKTSNYFLDYIFFHLLLYLCVLYSSCGGIEYIFK